MADHYQDKRVMLVSFDLLVVVVALVAVVFELEGILAWLVVFSVNSLLTSSVGFLLVFLDVDPSVVCSENDKKYI